MSISTVLIFLENPVRTEIGQPGKQKSKHRHGGPYKACTLTVQVRSQQSSHRTSGRREPKAARSPNFLTCFSPKLTQRCLPIHSGRKKSCMSYEGGLGSVIAHRCEKATTKTHLLRILLVLYEFLPVFGNTHYKRIRDWPLVAY